MPSVNFFQTLGNLAAKPTIKLNSVKHTSMLVCSAYNFYPKQIRVTWLRNGQEVTSAVTSSEAMPDGEWYYQIHSHLEHTPTAGEKITCMVEHLSLSEPVLQVWGKCATVMQIVCRIRICKMYKHHFLTILDPSLPAPERIKVAVGLCGLMLGLVIVSSGFIYYKKKSVAYFTLYQGEDIRRN